MRASSSIKREASRPCEESVVAKQQRCSTESMLPPVTTIRVSSRCQARKLDKQPTLQLDEPPERRARQRLAPPCLVPVPYAPLNEETLALSHPVSLKHSASMWSLGSVEVEVSSICHTNDTQLSSPPPGERPCETPPAGPRAFEAHKDLVQCLAPIKSRPLIEPSVPTPKISRPLFDFVPISAIDSSANQVDLALRLNERVHAKRATRGSGNS